MTVKERMDTIIKKALGEMAAVDCTLLEYMEGLDDGKTKLNTALLNSKENYYQEEVAKK